MNADTVKFDGRPITGVRGRLEAYFAGRGVSLITAMPFSKTDRP
jgi:hypothetical protein